MITGLLIAVLVFEIIRLILYILDSTRVSKSNNFIKQQQVKFLEFGERQHKEWKQLRKAEIEELKLLAKESDTMKQIYDEWLAIQKPESKESK